MRLITAFLNDDTGFIVSAELVIIATLAVLGMIVGFSQVQNAVVSEMSDVSHALGALNQSYYYSGFHARKWGGWTKSRTVGSAYYDFADACDWCGCMISCEGAVPEGGGGIAVGGGSYGARGGMIQNHSFSTETVCTPVCSGSVIHSESIIHNAPTCSGEMLMVPSESNVITTPSQQLMAPAPAHGMTEIAPTPARTLPPAPSHD
ncbi:hypothetical protein [Planctomicrobium sp. SH527]|uniref:hypothetical protein n=1 Tax=Planctomicrobium sp. SH527 TaxID=3448123 RepID=UPI003F5B259E